MASSSRDAVETPLAVAMHPLLLASVCSDDWRGLNYLLNRQEAQNDSSVNPSEEFLDQVKVYNSTSCCNNGKLQTLPVSGDEEQGVDRPPVLSADAALLLKGLTTEGNTALHLAATYGNLRCATIILEKDADLLFDKVNLKTDTPLHCAARAGKSEMVFHLIDLAIDFGRSKGVDGEKIVKDLLRKENDSKETALHEAVRAGDNQMVTLLMTYDPELATFPKEGTSPLYLSVLLEKDIIAKTLYGMSQGNVLSYSGPDGQNALHVAVLRSKGNHQV